MEEQLGDDGTIKLFVGCSARISRIDPNTRLLNFIWHWMAIASDPFIES